MERVPGVLQPAFASLEALGAGIDRDAAKRLLLLALRGAASKDAWQARRDSLQVLGALAAAAAGNPSDGGAAAASDAPLLQLLLGRKEHVLQVLDQTSRAPLAHNVPPRVALHAQPALRAPTSAPSLRRPSQRAHRPCQPRSFMSVPCPARSLNRRAVTALQRSVPQPATHWPRSRRCLMRKRRCLRQARPWPRQHPL